MNLAKINSNLAVKTHVFFNQLDDVISQRKEF